MKKKLRVMMLVMMILGIMSTTLTVNAATLNKKNLSINVKKTVTLTLKDAKGKVKWTTSDAKVATVTSKGQVKGIKKGKCTITAQNGKKKYICKVNVKQPVTSVTLNKRALPILMVGKSATLKATVQPGNASNKGIKWVSSNPSVATVSANGKVKAISAGDATITAYAKDGSKKNATCIVKVEGNGNNSSTGKKVDMKTRVGEPICYESGIRNLILRNYGFKVDSVNGVKFLWEAKNLSGKEIKYYTVTLYFYNRVGDPVYDEITHKSSKTFKFVGPVEPNGSLLIYHDVGYLPGIGKITVGDITLEYMDGTKETGWYGYYTKDRF